MPGSGIPDDDELFRHSVRPHGFKRDTFSPRGLFKLYDQADGSLLASVAWRHFLPTDDDVHGYGCRLASKQNAKLELDARLTNKTRRIYCGAYQLTAAAVRNLASIAELTEVAFADVSHNPEDGEIAHTDLRVQFRGMPADIEGTKTAILDRLWAVIRGPLRHVCPSDSDILAHPNLTMIEPPSGPYIRAQPMIDDRS
jgi:hypothetical protein